MPKFVQIVISQYYLYALDENGDVWRKDILPANTSQTKWLKVDATRESS